MNCERCEHGETKVLESRVTEEGEVVRRRRECLNCRYRFTTYERVERRPLWVVKRDGSTQPFERSKLLHGLVRACSKRDVPAERLEALVIEIETALRARNSSAASDEIGELALAGLRQIDDVAYVRFASVYHAFDRVEEFQGELEKLVATPSEHTHSTAR